MWTKDYQPTIRAWYLIKVEGKALPVMWNNHNQFFVSVAGNTYKFDKIDCWFDDTVDNELIDCIQNLIAAIDSPIAKNKLKGEFVDEARKIGNELLIKFGRKK